MLTATILAWVVREGHAYRHNRGSVEGFPYIVRYHITVMYERGISIRPPMMPRGTSVSGHLYARFLQKFQSGQNYTFLVNQKLGKITSAVRETGASLGIMGTISELPETPRIITTLSYRGDYDRPLIRPPLCRETPVSRTADT